VSYDVKYNASTTLGNGPDNVVGSDNNYETITGAASMVGRAVVSEAKQIDGEWIGNRAWKKLERELDTQSNRQLLVHYTEKAVQPLVDNGKITDLEITHDDSSVGNGAAMLVKFKDVRTGDTATLGFIVPWGKY
jgi:hypothetical protein